MFSVSLKPWTLAMSYASIQVTKLAIMDVNLIFSVYSYHELWLCSWYEDNLELQALAMRNSSLKS